jgi:hypothetical protein
MKKVFMTMALIVAIATSAAAMTNGQIRNHARSMTNKMVADLHLTRHQAARVYSINLEYLNTMDKPNANVRHLVNLRNHEMSRVLSAHQYRRYIASSDSHWYPAGLGHSWRHAAPKHHHNPRHHHHHRY